MPPIIKNNAWDTAKIAVVIAGMALGYNMYRDLGAKMDIVISTQQRLSDHETSDNATHTQIYNQIAEIRDKIESHITENRNR